MWIFAWLTLAFTAFATASDNDFKIVNTPYNLRVRKDSDTVVEIAWNFEKPERIPLREVEFVLLLESERLAPRIFYRRFNSEPFKTNLTHLSPGTEYTVKLIATCPQWPPSAPAVIAFVTLRADYPTPYITDVVENRRYNFMEFYLTYEVEWLPFVLRHFKIRVCDRSCFEYTRNRTELHARVPVEYQSEFSISVVAVYDAGDYGSARRESEPHTGMTERGRPGEVFDFMAEQHGNTIELEWHPPYHPRGPTSYYEVFVSNLDEGNGYVRRIEEESSSDMPALAPRLDGGAYAMGFETLDADRPDASVADKLRAFKFGQCKPLAPLLLVIVKRTVKSVRFRIVFEKPSNRSLFKIDHADSMRRLYLGSGVTDAFNLSPYTRMQYKIRSCITFEGKSIDICGNFTNFDTISNVAGPSRVLYPETNVWNGSLFVSWQEPENPRGPIDGYKLSIENIGNAAEPIKEIVLNATERSYIFAEYVTGQPYNIGIVAFNLDLDDENLHHLGEWRFVSSPFAGVLRHVSLPLFIICFIGCFLVLDLFLR